MVCFSELQCPLLNDIVVKPLLYVIHDRKVVFSCEEGYRLSDENSSLTCQSNETWAGEIPVCQSKSTCPKHSPGELKLSLIIIVFNL